jgi:hypothetical protein
MPAAATLVLQTTYAELLERCAVAAFSQAFSDNGNFVAKTLKGRRYWYFQGKTTEGRAQRYVGPETPELLERIAKHREIRDDERERHALVVTLVRSFSMPRPPIEICDVIEALAKAGVFRLRSVLVGTVAYQTYSAMLGVRLPFPALQTGDIDIAQFKEISVLVEDKTPPVLDVLKGVDPSFRAVPHRSDKTRVATYRAKGGLRVDFLTPNRGRETDRLQPLPALGTDAQPMRFLDYLIRDRQPAAILHGPGVYVHVPAPERFAVHKLIVARRRSQGTGKADKDLAQAEALLNPLAQKRPHELKAAWHEAYQRGGTWRKLLGEGLGMLTPRGRDLTLKVANEGAPRNSVLPSLDLTFSNLPAHYDLRRDVVTFSGRTLGGIIECAISREALDDHFGADKLGHAGRFEKFLEKRSAIEAMAREKYLFWPIEEPGAVLIKTMDVPELKLRTGSRRQKKT